MAPRRPKCRNLGLLVLGIVANTFLLIIPAAACGRLDDVETHGVALRFLVLAGIFCGVELWLTLTIVPGETHLDNRGPVWDRAARRLASATGLVVLAMFSSAVWYCTSVPGEPSLWLQGAGAVLMLAGTVLRGMAILQLGVRFRTEVYVDTRHRLTQAGIYGLVRHPSETGLLAASLGACLGTGWWWGLALWGTTLIPLVVARVSLEESCLEAAHGDNYREYKRHVRRFLPKIYGWTTARL